MERDGMQNFSANFVAINLQIHFKRFIFINFWKQNFSLTELMSCFGEDIGRALQSIAGQIRKVNLPDGTINFLLKKATCKNILLKK